MKKYKIFQEETILKVGYVCANSEEEAQRKAEDVDWNSIEEDDIQTNHSVSLYLEDEEVIIDANTADEGWLISYNIYLNTYRIEKNDDCASFKDDICAIQYVIASMLGGSKLHIRAFKFAYANGSEDDRKVLLEELHYAILSK
jgi:hypothetical protein